jgi:large subunit ribosomal protein L31
MNITGGSGVSPCAADHERKTKMKNDIHPEYKATKVTCACGNEFETRSTDGEIRLDVCSACHPFFTGQQKFINRGGRVEKFKNKYNL